MFTCVQSPLFLASTLFFFGGLMLLQLARACNRMAVLCHKVAWKGLQGLGFWLGWVAGVCVVPLGCCSFCREGARRRG